MKTKKELEQSVMMLEDALQTSKSNATEYQADLELAKKQLADINKPVLTGEQLDDINRAVEKAVDDFDFNDTDNYDKEFSMEYDGKVHLESIDLTCSYELVEQIVQKVQALFVEADNNI
tara:strand:- start:368 stop:724 length:357 start_codon:yes stop_codon:yes gene_type:complete